MTAISRGPFASCPADPLPAHGPDATLLLRGAVEAGRRTLAAVARRVAGRGEARLTPADRAELAAAFAAVTAAGDLLGRVKAVELARRASPRTYAAPAGRPAWFAAGGRLPVLAPLDALRYILRLVPRLGVDPERWGAGVERHAMTLARATELTLVEKVQRAIAADLSGESERDDGGRPLTGTEAVYRRLEEAGVADADGSYAEMCFRTNAADALTTGFDRRLADPDMQELFPAWRYDTARDSRVGKDHRPKNGRYYPASATFAEVRGDRPFNCRCTRVPLSASQWDKLQAAGAKLESSW